MYPYCVQVTVTSVCRGKLLQNKIHLYCSTRCHVELSWCRSILRQSTQDLCWVTETGLFLYTSVSIINYWHSNALHIYEVCSRPNLPATEFQFSVEASLDTWLNSTKNKKIALYHLHNTEWCHSVHFSSQLFSLEHNYLTLSAAAV